MQRRQFITLLGGAAAASPSGVSAQTPSKRPLIGFLAPSSKATSERFHDGFPQGMRELGYLEARDYTLEARYADGDLNRLPLLAKELVRLEPSLIVAGAASAALASKQATTTIPIVGVNVNDPIGIGLVTNEAPRNQCDRDSSPGRGADWQADRNRPRSFAFGYQDRSLA